MAFRFATCNEIFQHQSFEKVCEKVSNAGYTGLEIAPFTLGPDPTLLTKAERLSIRQAMQNTGLHFVGLHWLLSAPTGLHATTRDKALRERTWKYVEHFVDLCADLGDNAIVVFGSPKQRNSRDGLTPQEATSHYIDGMAKIAPHAEARGVTVLVEALSPDQSDVVTSLAEAVSIVKQVGSPAIQTMFDVHNAVAEETKHTELIREFFQNIKHVHVNEMDGKEPGTGDYDFAGLMNCLNELNYSGWVSLEAFDFTRDPVEIISRSLKHLKT